MSKVLVFLRTSTEAQEIDGQKQEMIDFVKGKGYSEDDIIFIEMKGASAIKLNEKYLKMLSEVKEYVEKKIIDCVAVWHMNRLGRNDRVLIDLKNLFIDNKIQFLCKTPGLTLLNEDGSVNTGSELAYGLFATMVKQDMEEKVQKFKRTKHRYAAEGKFCGGVNMRFGYRVGENKYYVEDEIDGPIVRLIYELYSTGQYSTLKLANEINNRGIVRKNGKPMYAWLVDSVLVSKAYTGVPNEKYHNRIYPAIITQELYDKCEVVRKSNKIFERKNKAEKEVNLASRLIRCTKCGKLYISDGALYSCNGHNNREAIYCDNDLSVNKIVMDELCWRVASTCHLDWLMDMSDDKLEEYKEELAVTEKKITTLEKKFTTIENKKQRVVDTYLEGLINKENRDLKLNKIQEEVSLYTNELNALREAKNRLLGLIESYAKRDEVEVFMSGIDTIDIANKYDIVHQHIKGIKLYRIQYGPRSKSGKDNGVDIRITTILDKEWRFMYIPQNKRKDNKLFIWNGHEWVSDYKEVEKGLYI
jgi:site-specific DNA recombinase